MTHPKFQFKSLIDCISSILGDTCNGKFAFISRSACDCMIDMYHYFDKVEGYNMQCIDHNGNEFDFINAHSPLNLSSWASNNQFSAVFFYDCGKISTAEDLLYMTNRIKHPKRLEDNNQVIIIRPVGNMLHASFINTGIVCVRGGIND